MIKQLKQSKLSVLALALGFSVLFLLFSFSEDKPIAAENGNTAVTYSNPLDAAYQPNEMHTYALWHDIHF